MKNAGLTLEDFLPRLRGGDTRAWMNSPFTLTDGYAYATNGFIIARRKLGDREQGRFADLPNGHAGWGSFASLITNALQNPAQLAAPAITGFSVCPTCYGGGKVPEKICPECKGKGEFTHGTHDYECKECDSVGWVDAYTSDPAHQMNWCHACGGEGVLINPNDYTMVAGVCLSTRYLHLLQGATLYLGGPLQTQGWTIGDFEGAVMPIKP